MEDSRDGDEKLLVTRGHYRGEEVYRGVQHLPEKQKLHRATSGETNAKFST